MKKANKNNQAVNQGYVVDVPEPEPNLYAYPGVKKKHNPFKPNYYREAGKDLLQRFEEGLLTKKETVGFYKGNIMKYLTRFEQKNGIEDLIKAQTYLNRLIEFETEPTSTKKTN